MYVCIYDNATWCYIVEKPNLLKSSWKLKLKSIWMLILKIEVTLLSVVISQLNERISNTTMGETVCGTI